MCSYPFRKTAELEEVLSNKSIVHSLIIKDFSYSRILIDSMQPKFVPFIELNQNLTKNKQNKINPKQHKAISLFMYKITKKDKNQEK